MRLRSDGKKWKAAYFYVTEGASDKACKGELHGRTTVQLASTSIDDNKRGETYIKHHNKSRWYQTQVIRKRNRES